MASSDEKVESALVQKLINEPIASETSANNIRIWKQSRKNAVIKMTECSIEAIETLVDIMRHGKSADRLKAATKILEYGVGLPADVYKARHDQCDDETVTDAEFEEIIDGRGEEEMRELIEKGYVRGK